MDHRRFDQLARDLAGARSRRSLLRGFGVALAGALAAGVQPAAADNECKPSGNLPQSKCNKGAQCCSGVCSQGQCCTPLTVASCTLAQCGQTIADTCGGTITCPACPTTTTTTTSTTTTPAPCVPNCTGKTCGSDGCGGSCGTCSGPGVVTCDVGNCCQEGLGSFENAVCSATLPCCDAACQNGICCLPAGIFCNGHNELCCSGVCNTNGFCA